MIVEILSFISDFILEIIKQTGYFGVFILMFFQSANIPIPSEITMIFSGFLVSRGIFNFFAVVLIGALGNLAGALFSYYSASFLIKNGLREKYKILGFLISDRNLELAQKFFDKWGGVSVFFARMIPVVSTFISFPAGLAKMKIRVFAVLTLAGSLIWSGFLTFLGLKAGENWQALQFYFRKFDYLVLAAILLFVFLWLKNHFSAKIKNKISCHKEIC